MKILNILIFSLCFASAQNIAGNVKNLKGDVQAVQKDKSRVLQVGDKIFEGDSIKTAKGASVGILLEDDTTISVGSNSVFSIDEYVFEPSKKNVSFKSNLSKGTLGCVTGLISKINPDAMKLKAKSASMGIRGTHFIVEVGDE